jgi:hypothetical protein
MPERLGKRQKKTIVALGKKLKIFMAHDNRT